jgi:hypothetical protein
MQQNNICICGHRGTRHITYSSERCWSLDCFCTKFVIDNLRYLEDLYEKETTKA